MNMRFMASFNGRETELAFHGRAAWALSELIRAGEAGCTPIDHPGPRWSAYVFTLRKAGLVVVTIHEKHGGPFAGTHARYVLRTPCRVVSIDREAA